MLLAIKAWSALALLIASAAELLRRPDESASRGALRTGPDREAYDIEDTIRLRSPDERLAVRQSGASRCRIAWRHSCAIRKPAQLPKSQYGQTIAYVLNHWDELRRFTEDGHLEIDNNTVKRTLRLCAISRKNWLFVGSDQGGETAAICFSILAGASAIGSNRWRM